MNTQNIIKKFKENKNSKKKLRNVLTVLGVFVFFVTTYVFLLPALAYSDPVDYVVTFNKEKTLENYTETIINENNEEEQIEKTREIDNNNYVKINYVYFEKNNKENTMYYLNHTNLLVDRNITLEELFNNSKTIEQDETIYELKEIQILINNEWINLENENIELKDNNWFIGNNKIDNNTNLRVIYTYEYEESTLVENITEIAEKIIEKPKGILRSFKSSSTIDELTSNQICDTTDIYTEGQLLKNNTYNRGDLVNPCTGESVEKVGIYAGKFEKEGDVQVRKIVEKTDTLGKYNVKFQVRGKGYSRTYAQDVYIVVVLDVSGSMGEGAKHKESRNVYQYKEKYCSSWSYTYCKKYSFRNAETYDENKIGDDGNKATFLRIETYDTNVAEKWYQAKNGAKSFASNILTKLPNAKLALVRYSGYNNDNDGKYNDAEKTRGFESTNFDNVDFEKAFSGTDKGTTAAPNGGTNTEGGLRAARELLESSNIPNNAAKYVVLISDGEPTFYYAKDGKTDGVGNNNTGNGGGGQTNFNNSKNAAINEKKKFSSDITFFSIGYDVDANGRAEIFLKNDIASQTSNYYAADPTTIAQAFNAISEEINAPAGTIDKTQGVTDKSGLNFTWEGHNNQSINFNPSEKIEITEEWKTIGSYITEDIDESVMDYLYKTNNGFKLTYSKNNYNESTHETTQETKEIKCDIDPYAYWSQTDLIIKYYYDGIEDETLRKTLNSGGETGFVYTEGMKKGINDTNDVKDTIHLKDGYIFIDVKDKNGSKITPINGEYNIPINIERGTNIINVYYVSGHELPETGSRGELICLYMGLTIMLGTLIYGYIYYKKETN